MMKILTIIGVCAAGAVSAQNAQIEINGATSGTVYSTGPFSVSITNNNNNSTLPSNAHFQVVYNTALSNGGWGATTVLSIGTDMSIPPLGSSTKSTTLNINPSACMRIRGEVQTGLYGSFGPWQFTPYMTVCPGSQTCAANSGLTWKALSKDAVTGAIHVGRHANTDPLNGDTNCNQQRPVLCINDSANFPKPASLNVPINIPPWPQSNTFHAWSRAVVGTTQPISGCMMTTLTEANDVCTAEFGAGWRVAEWHDGVGHSLWAFGNVGNDNDEFWVDINDQPNGTCWSQ